MKFHEFGDKNLPPYLADTWRWQFLVELSSSKRILSENTVLFYLL